jgi:hypothetical protein
LDGARNQHDNLIQMDVSCFSFSYIGNMKIQLTLCLY